MPRGILHVASRPTSEADAEAFHRWYDEIHLKQLVAIEGFRSARRFEPLSGEGDFLAIYEIEADDLGVVAARLKETNASGELSPPVGVRLDPPPVVQFFREITTYTP